MPDGCSISDHFPFGLRSREAGMRKKAVVDGLDILPVTETEMIKS